MRQEALRHKLDCSEMTQRSYLTILTSEHCRLRLRVPSQMVSSFFNRRSKALSKDLFRWERVGLCYPLLWAHVSFGVARIFRKLWFKLTDFDSTSSSRCECESATMSF